MDQFWDMTPKELYLYAKGWAAKEKAIDQRMAWAMANIINPHVKRRLKPADFMRGSRPPLLPKDKAEMVAYMDKQRARLLN